MPALGIVEHLDVIEDICPGLRARTVHLPGYALHFERREEAFHGGVIPHLASTAHAAGDSLLNQQLLEVLAGVLDGFNRSSQH